MLAAWWQSTNEAQLQCAAAGRQCSAGNDAQQAAMQLTATESRNRQQRSRQQRRQRQWRCMQREPTRPPSGDAPPRGRAGVPREAENGKSSRLGCGIHFSF